MRRLLLLTLGLAGCSCASAPREVLWPASAEVGMRDELAVTARETGNSQILPPAGEPTDAPALPEDAPGIRARSFVYDGLWVAEVVLGYVEDDTFPLPLVVMFHGRGDRPRIPGGPMGRVPTAMRVLIPRGPLAIGGGFAWARHSVTQNRHEELASDLVRISDRIVELIDHVRQTRPTVGTPIVTGFSQGGMLAWVIAVRHPTRIGLALPIAGWVPPDARPPALRAAPTRAMHGTADPIVPIGPTRELVWALREADNAIEWTELPDVEHVVTPEMNGLFESWLEAALHERAPELTRGLGEAGPDPEPIDPYDEPVGEVDLEEEALPAPTVVPLEIPDPNGETTTQDAALPEGDAHPDAP